MKILIVLACGAFLHAHSLAQVAEKPFSFSVRGVSVQPAPMPLSERIPQEKEPGFVLREDRQKYHLLLGARWSSEGTTYQFGLGRTEKDRKFRFGFRAEW